MWRYRYHRDATPANWKPITGATHLFSHSILMVAISQVEAHGIGEVEVNLVDVPMPFPKLA